MVQARALDHDPASRNRRTVMAESIEPLAYLRVERSSGAHMPELKSEWGSHGNAPGPMEGTTDAREAASE
jgi:hypothetical protein